MRFLWKGSALLLLVFLAIPPAEGLTDEEIFRDLRFNFINPGGRSLGMGGAFISLADDATAAQANPSGLTTLLSPQFFLEVRFADRDTIRTTRSFTNPIDDTGFDVLVQTEPDGIVSPSFLSYVYPRDRWTFGVSRQEVLNTDNRTSSTYEFIFGDESDIRTAEGEIDVELINWNLSAAFMAHERFRIGATASLGVFDLSSRVVNSYVDPSGQIIGDPALAGVPFEMYRTTTEDSDTDLTFTVGVLWQIADRVTFGASYRQGGEFEVRETLSADPIDPALLPGLINSTVFFNESGTFLTPENNSFDFANVFNVPDVLVGGISWRPINNLTLALDVAHIQYGDLVEEFNSRLNVLTAGFETDEEAAFTLDDQTNLHFGAEYLLKPIGSARVILRAGYHQDKDNRLRSDFAPGGFGLGSNDNFPGRDNEDHYSVGVGVVIGNHFQLDTAVDFSDPAVEGVVSLIYKF